MYDLKFARLIEANSKSLAESLVHELRTGARTPSFHQIPAADLHEEFDELYLHLTQWLITNTEGDVERRQSQLGAYRAAQRIPVDEFLWALLLSKRKLFEYLQREVTVAVPYELIFEIEFMQALNDFFDRAIYHAIVGYVHHQAKESAQNQRSQIHA